MINLKQLYCKTTLTSNLLTESKKSHLKHLFEDGTLRFDDFRNILKTIFSGKIGISNKVNKIPLSISYKNGLFVVANDEKTIKDPFTLDLVCLKCKCNSIAKEALKNSLKNLIKGLSSLNQIELNGIFANGLNFYDFDVVIPPDDCIKAYGNKCFIQCNRVNCYDNTFKKVIEDEESTKKLSDNLTISKYILINNPRVSIDNINKLRQSTSPDMALKELSSELEKIIDGIGYKASVNDYVRERYAKHIVNCALQNGIDVYHNSDFVNELIARLSYISDHRPNRNDLITYAKRDGIDFRSPEYKNFIELLESTADETNDSIIKPVEHLVLRAGVLLIKCLVGMIAVDPRNSCKRYFNDLDNAVIALEDESDGLTPEKIKLVRKCMKALDAYQNTIPKEGILFMYNNKICKLCGKFGAINNLMKLMNY